MAVTLYLKAGWLYIVGVIVIIIGLYIFFTIGLLDTSMMPNAFYVMFFGFVLSVFGGVHGRHVIKSPEFRNILQSKKGKKEKGMVLEELEESILEGKPKKVEKEQMEKKKFPEPSKVPTKPLPGIMPGPSVPKIELGDKVVKVIICSHCGEENKYTAKFCDNCGRGLKPKEGENKA